MSEDTDDEETESDTTDDAPGDPAAGEGAAFVFVEPEPEDGEDAPEEEGDAEDAQDAEDEEPAGAADAGEEDAGDAGEDDGISPLPLASVVEAVLFAAREPLKLAHIARAVGKRTRTDAVRAAVDELNVLYLETSRAFEIAEISGRFQLMSRPEYADHIMRIYPKRELTDKDAKSQRLTPAMLDTLAIVAYKQPVMRSEIEHIRGVACGPVLRTLIERGSVREIGRRTDLVGKPAVFGTTDHFLIEFGLGSLDELPLRSEFAAPGAPPPMEMAAAEPAEPEADAAAEAEAGGASEAETTTSVATDDMTPADDGEASPESSDDHVPQNGIPDVYQ